MQININIAVDVVAALSDQSLENHVFLMDNSVYPSTGQGTGALATACQAGQVIQWLGYAIDLQTPISIKNIRFLSAQGGADGAAPDGNPDLNAWTGIVPWYMVQGLPYLYRLELQMGEGKENVLSMDTAALIRI